MPTHLITGGAGFIGSHLAERLLERGDQVVVLDNLSTGRMSNIAHLEGKPGFRCLVEDVCNESLTEELVREVDSIFHLAASVGVRLVIERPTEVLINNILGTEIVLKFACRFRKRVLVASTSEVYGKSDKKTFHEDDDRIMGPTSRSRWGYATSKAVDEFLALAYHEEKNLPVAIARLFNTVGPRQTGQYGMVIPNFVKQALLGEPIQVYGDGSQTRCFAHIGDIAPALIGLLEEPKAYGQVFNVGSQEEISMKELARKIVEKTGSASEIHFLPYEKAYGKGFEDMMRRVPDTTRIRELLGYESKYSLEDILTDVIEEMTSAL